LTIEKELSKRKLSDVATEKLMELQIKFIDELRKEHVEPRYLSDADLRDLKSQNWNKMDSEEISIEIYQLFLRYRADCWIRSGRTGKLHSSKPCSGPKTKWCLRPNWKSLRLFWEGKIVWHRAQTRIEEGSGQGKSRRVGCGENRFGRTVEGEHARDPILSEKELKAVRDRLTNPGEIKIYNDWVEHSVVFAK